jgi:hypothetical protein
MERIKKYGSLNCYSSPNVVTLSKSMKGVDDHVSHMGEVRKACRTCAGTIEREEKG